MESLQPEAMKMVESTKEFKATDMVVKKMVEIIRNLGGQAVVSVRIPKLSARVVIFDNSLSKDQALELALEGVQDLSAEVGKLPKEVTAAVVPLKQNTVLN